MWIPHATQGVHECGLRRQILRGRQRAISAKPVWFCPAFLRFLGSQRLRTTRVALWSAMANFVRRKVGWALAMRHLFSHTSMASDAIPARTRGSKIRLAKDCAPVSMGLLSLARFGGVAEV